MTTATKKGPVVEVPIEEIEKLAAIHEHVIIKLLRRNDKGQLAMLYSGQRFATVDLATIDAWAEEQAGGGRYRVEIYQADAPTQRPMAPFEFRVEGPPRPRKNLNAPAGVGPGGGALPNYPLNPTPERYDDRYQGTPAAWAAGLDPRVGSQYMAQHAAQAARENQPAGLPSRFARGGQLPPGATMASDALAMQQIKKLEAMLAKSEEQAKAQQVLLERELERSREEAQRSREKAREERHAAEISALKSLIESKTAAPEKSNTIAETIAMLAPFVPVMQSLVASRSDQSSKAVDAQMQGVNSLMQATLQQANNRPDMVGTLTSLAPLLGPVITKFFDQRAPEQQAALYQAMSEQNLNSVAMLAQLVEAMAPQDAQEQPWFGAIRDALGSVVNMTQAYMQGQGLPGQQPAPLPPGGAVPLQQIAEATGGGSSYTSAPTPAPGADAAMFALLPTAYQTREWRQVLEVMHQSPAPDVEVAATVLVKQLEHLLDFDMLPQELAALPTQPRETLQGILAVLPITQRAPAFSGAVLDATLGMLHEDGYLTPIVAAPPQAAVVAEQPSITAAAFTSASEPEPKSEVAQPASAPTPEA